MNTLIPYTAGIYHDSRPVVGIKAEDVLPLDVDDTLGWNPHAAPAERDCLMLVMLLLCRELDTRIQTALISERWTSGTPANP